MNSFFRFYSVVQEPTEINHLDVRLVVLLNVAQKLLQSISSISKELQKGNGNSLENKELLKIPKLVEKLNIFNAFVETKSEFYSSKIERQQTPIAELSASIVKQASTSARMPSNFEMEEKEKNPKSMEDQNENNNEDEEEEIGEILEHDDPDLNLREMLNLGKKGNDQNNKTKDKNNNNIISMKRKRTNFNANAFTAEWVENDDENDENNNNNNNNNDSNNDSSEEENNNNNNNSDEEKEIGKNSTNKNTTKQTKKKESTQNDKSKKSKKRKVEKESETIVLSFQK